MNDNYKSMDVGLLGLRVLGGLALIRAHGLPKLLYFQETLGHMPDPFGLGSAMSAYVAIFTNVVCALLVVFGLFTRLASACILGVTMTGLFFVHLEDGAKIQDVPLIYSILFGYLLYSGGGIYSFDRGFKKSMW